MIHCFYVHICSLYFVTRSNVPTPQHGVLCCINVETSHFTSEWFTATFVLFSPRTLPGAALHGMYIVIIHVQKPVYMQVNHKLWHFHTAMLYLLHNRKYFLEEQDPHNAVSVDIRVDSGPYSSLIYTLFCFEMKIAFSFPSLTAESFQQTAGLMSTFQITIYAFFLFLLLD